MVCETLYSSSSCSILHYKLQLMLSVGHWSSFSFSSLSWLYLLLMVFLWLDGLTWIVYNVPLGTLDLCRIERLIHSYNVINYWW
jgi:hypothetical protein